MLYGMCASVYWAMCELWHMCARVCARICTWVRIRGFWYAGMHEWVWSSVWDVVYVHVFGCVHIQWCVVGDVRVCTCG